jgi:hypothetical protein
VRTNELWGGGSYIFTNVDPTLHAARGFEVPVTPGVRMHHLLTVSLNAADTIDHVVNDTGARWSRGLTAARRATSAATRDHDGTLTEEGTAGQLT